MLNLTIDLFDSNNSEERNRVSSFTLFCLGGQLLGKPNRNESKTMIADDASVGKSKQKQSFSHQFRLTN